MYALKYTKEKSMYEILSHTQTDVPWHVIFLIIMSAAAILSFSLTVTIKKWVDKGWFPGWAILPGFVVSVVLSSIAGTLVGLAVWDPILGGVTAFFGSVASVWLMPRIEILIDYYIKKITNKEITSKTKREDKKHK